MLYNKKNENRKWNVCVHVFSLVSLFLFFSMYDTTVCFFFLYIPVLFVLLLFLRQSYLRSENLNGTKCKFSKRTKVSYKHHNTHNYHKHTQQTCAHAYFLDRFVISFYYKLYILWHFIFLCNINKLLGCKGNV